MAFKCSNRTLWTTADEDGYPYWVEFEDRPFAKGNSKFMYKGRLNGKGPRSGDYCTLKVFRTIDIAKHEDWSLYKSRAEKANKLAAQFNKLLDNQYKVKFLVPVLALIDISSTCTDCIYFLSNTKRIRSDDCVAVEPYVGDKFRKFYRNSPLKGAEHAYVLQAFSHFTASQTGDTLICGLQGEAHGPEFVLTNPIIHSANQEWGPKDQGAEGFKKFFSAHICNHICQSLDLPEYLETMSVSGEMVQDTVEGETSKKIIETSETSEIETMPKEVLVSTDEVKEEVTHPDVEPLPPADTTEEIKKTPAILQTPPMRHEGRTIVAPVSMEISLSRSSSVTGPPVFVEDIPGESISRPLAESVILDATPIDDITPQLSDSQEALPPPCSEYLGPFTPCRTVNEYLELRKSHASFSPGSESIPLIDDELACAESKMKEVLPPPTDDFEPTISPSLNSYLKDKESLEIIPRANMDLDLESRQSISVFEDIIPAPDLGSTDNSQMLSPRESITRDMEKFESLVNTPCGTTSQESLVTTPCGSIRQEVDSQPSIVSTPKDSVSHEFIQVSELPLESAVDLQVSTEIPPDIESQVCLVSIPPDCMDHHLDTLESLEAMSPASEKLRSVELMTELKWPSAEPGEESVPSGVEPVLEEQISAQEFSETKTIQETGTESFESSSLDNVEVEVPKPVCVDTISSDFKQSLETIPEGSTESDSAHSLENESLAPEVSTEGESAVGTMDSTTIESQTSETVSQETTGETSLQPAGEATVSQETTVETSAEPAGEATVSQETTVETSAEPAGEATVSQETTVETSAEPAGEATVSQETTVETSAEPAGEATVSQETTVETSAEPAGEATMSQETTVETSAEPAGETTATQETTVETSAGEAAVSQETTVETSAEPAGEATMSQETTVETSAGGAAVSQETTVETSAEPAGEAAVLQETTVETSAEPAGEATVSQETTVETSAEPAGGAAVSQETTIETSAEPAGEAAVSQETTVEASAEPAGEAAVSQETTVETSAEPAGEAAVSQETTVETSAEPTGEATVSHETTIETSAEPVGEATISQETTIETSTEPAGEATVSHETTVETSADPAGEATVSQETTVETSAEPAGEATVSQETTTETSTEATGDATGECVVSHVISEPIAQEPYIGQERAMGEVNVSQNTVVERTEEANICQQTAVESTNETCLGQDTVLNSTNQSPGNCCLLQDNVTESLVETRKDGDLIQEAAVETTAESNICQSSEFVSTSGTAEGYSSQEAVAEAANEEGYIYQGPETGTTANVAGETYWETSGSAVEATSGYKTSHQDLQFEPTVSVHTSQNGGFSSVTETRSSCCSNEDQSFTGKYDYDPSSNIYSHSSETLSYPTEANRATTSQVTDSYFYGVPPEYKISEDCTSSQWESGYPQSYPKMTIVPDLDTMEYVETKCLDSVYEEHDVQQGIETLPRRKLTYLEPQESHEIITFRINISPEQTTPDQRSDECVYQNIGTLCQRSNLQESNLSSANYCTTCQPQEASENVGETSGQDSRSVSSFSYHYSQDTNDCTESMPQRSCGYSSEVHQSVPADWSPTQAVWDDGQCSTSQNLQTTPRERVDSEFGPSV
ncbi:unnamed protein product [Acanthosepion pharaonis]|uniref:Alpha-type protein kinase domain-containing protein n=1 Tax=Acanthosepion pharaonis TaxID=158019 RepID=A0A812AYF6_ACAPH|nr:unnamed protein product [Sepia pharaonis]